MHQVTPPNAKHSAVGGLCTAQLAAQWSRVGTPSSKLNPDRLTATTGGSWSVWLAEDDGRLSQPVVITRRSSPFPLSPLIFSLRYSAQSCLLQPVDIMVLSISIKYTRKGCHRVHFSRVRVGVGEQLHSEYRWES